MKGRMTLRLNTYLLEQVLCLALENYRHLISMGEGGLLSESLLCGSS